MSIVTKHCPDCGARLAVRANRATGEEFLGCSKYPSCKHTEPLPEHVKMQLAGAEMLPGFGEEGMR